MADLKNDLEKARSFFSGNAGFVLLSLGLSFPRKALRTIFVGVTIAIFIAASLLMVAMFGSGFLADMPIDKRQIALSLPAPPVLSEAVKEERAKGLEAKVSTIKNLYGASSESYYKICETAGDFYKGQNDPTKAMQYYGPAAVCLSALGLQQSVETANLYIKEAECCIPVRYELAFQRDRLDEARSILSPLMTNDDFALAQYITATCLQATAELKLAAVRDGHAVVHLNAAETLYRSAVNLCVGRVLDKHVFYPLYLIPALTEAGDYFYYRAKTATDSDAVDKAIIYGRAAYKVAQRQAEANAEYKLASVSCWNRLGMLEIKARDFNLAVDYFNLALRLLNETALTENVYRAKILYNLADAYLLQHAWANWLNTKVEICKLPRSF